MKLSIVVPAYNESETIPELLNQIDSSISGHEKEIIIIDDGSTEELSSFIKDRPDVKLIRHPYNIGNGAAVKKGIKSACGDAIALLDADLQHPPKELIKLLNHIPDYDMVVGSRIAFKGHYSRRAANRVFNRLASYVTGQEIIDLTSGFRVIKADLAKRFVYLLPNGFSYPATLTLALLKSGGSLKFHPVEMAQRDKGRSKISPLKDGVKFMLIIAKIATIYSPFKVFLPVSMFFFLAGLGYYVYTFMTMHRFTNMSLFLFSTSVIIFMLSLIAEQISQLFIKEDD